ncbi:MAG: hypothetical protein Ta2F_03080 [Termitinemataceae bacterium]|nr:MAG: hypothetical protein Ta2F_03080 [Termitinemataceae bacterium]
MASDVHCHPFDLSKLHLDCEVQRSKLTIPCLSSAWNNEDWTHNETLSKNALGAQMLLGFAVHPQLPASDTYTNDALLLLNNLVLKKRIHAIGETGFDFFNENFKRTEQIQTELFESHLKYAIDFELPMVLHIRKAMQKIFSYSKQLKKVKAVIFHSYSSTAEDAVSLLKHGVNAYFSFGNAICLNHKTAQRACAQIPADRLLFETDAPYQPLGGKQFSTYADIFGVIKQAALLRQNINPISAAELEHISDKTFKKILAPPQKKLPPQESKPI